MKLNNIAMDLKRAAIGSGAMSKVFLAEARLKSKNIKATLPDYIKKILNDLKINSDREDLLMYSTLLQNYSLYGRK